MIGDLCGKGYSRMNEFEAHESSYDHQHKKRFMEMKQMQRGSTTVEARRERERRAEEKAGLITIKPITLGSSGEGQLAKTHPSNTKVAECKDTSSFARKGHKSTFVADDPAAESPEKNKVGRGFKKAFATSEGKPPATRHLDTLGNIVGGLEGSDADDDDFTFYNPLNPSAM